MKSFQTTVSALALVFLSFSGALAEERVVVKMDETLLLDVAGAPGAVVIGNPSIADATAHGSKIFLHGRSYGSTNITVLDEDGKKITAFDITVQVGSNDNVAMFKAGSRYSYVCAPLCQASMQVGDSNDFVNALITLNQKKIELATGKSSAQSASPPIPAQ
jgi:Flp pilus assembly secretin CpaC